MLLLIDGWIARRIQSALLLTLVACCIGNCNCISACFVRSSAINYNSFSRKGQRKQGTVQYSTVQYSRVLYSTLLSIIDDRWITQVRKKERELLFLFSSLLLLNKNAV